jgi:sulfur carrier protein ThiS
MSRRHKHRQGPVVNPQQPQGGSGETDKPRKSVVTVVRTGATREVPYVQGITAEDAIRQVGFTIDGASEVRVNGAICKNMRACLSAGDQVTILGNIRGA